MAFMDDLLHMFAVRDEKRLVVETAEAQQARVELEALKDQPGWTRLVVSLTEGLDAVYAEWEDRDPKPEEKAFVKLAKRLRDGPEHLLAEAQAIIASARLRRNGR